jgi:O-antigen/teichoic acid export membrane protein
MATDVAWSAISDGLAIVVNLVSFILVFNTLPLEVYGGYVGIYGVIGPLGALTWSGVSLLILQRVIRENDPPAVVFSRTFTLTLAQGLLATGAAILIAGEVISTLGTTEIVLMAVAELLLYPVSTSIATMVQAVKGFAAAARLRILLPLVRLAALLLTQALGALTVRNLAIAWIVGFTLTGVLSLAIVLPTLGIRRGATRPPATYIRGNLELALPLTASNLQANGDKAVMNAYGLEVDAGFYGAAYRVIMLSQMPMKTMNKALFQRFLPDDEETLGQHVRRAKHFSMVSVPMGLVIAAVVFVAAPGLEFIVGDKISESVSMIRWLLPVVPLFAVSRAPLNGLLGLGRSSLRAGVLISSSVLSMTIYLILIPTMSWRGAVIGTILSELYLTSVGWYLLVRAQAEADDAARMGPQGAGGGTTSNDEPASV